jgi:hypothetical protein
MKRLRQFVRRLVVHSPYIVKMISCRYLKLLINVTDVKLCIPVQYYNNYKYKKHAVTLLTLVNRFMIQGSYLQNLIFFSTYDFVQ